MNDHEIPWRDMVAALHRRRRLIANVWISGAAIIAFALLMTGPRYESTAKLMVTNDRPSTIAPEDAAAPAEKVSDEDLNAEVTLLSSDGLVREVLEPYRGTPYEPAEGAFKRFTGLPRDVVSWVYRTLHGIPQESSFDRWVDHTRKHLEVELVKKSNLISVSYGDRSVSPEWTSKLVNDLIDKHLQHHDRRSRQSDAFRFYENQLAVLHGKVSEAEQAQQAFFQREGLDSLPEQRGNWRQRLVDLNTELATAERDLTSVQARADFLAAEIKNHPKTVTESSRAAQNQAVQFLKPKILEKEIQRSELLSVYAPTSSKVVAVEKELADAKRLLKQEKETIDEATTTVNPTYQALEIDLAQTRATLSAAQAKVTSLKAQIAECRAKIDHLDGVAAEQDHLQQQVDTARQALAIYSKKAEQARLSSALDDSRIVNLAIAEPAEVPPAPASSHALVILLAAVLLSLMVAVVCGLARDWLDPTVKNGAQARRTAALPVLAEVSSS